MIGRLAVPWVVIVRSFTRAGVVYIGRFVLVVALPPVNGGASPGFDR